MAKKPGYNDESIVALKGKDRVRKKPAVIFGSSGIDGCEHSIFEIVSNSVDEAREGFGDKIVVTRFADNSVEVQDFGRGIPVDYNQKEGRFNWELVFCELYASGKYNNGENGNYEFSLGTNGLGLCATQYASEYMEAEIHTGGFRYLLNFKKGDPDGEMLKEAYTKKDTGSRIKWKPDLEVFTDINVSLEYLQEMLKNQSVVNAGVRFILRNQVGKGFETYEYYYENGINDYIKEKVGENALTSFLSWSGESMCRDRDDLDEYKLKMSFALTFSNKVQMKEYYHNSSYLANGGSPDKAVRQAFLSQIDLYLKQSNKYQKSDGKITFQDIEDCLAIVVSAFSTQASYENQTKKSINNKGIQDAMTAFIRHQLEIYFIENPMEANKIADQILINMRSRVNAEKTRLGLKESLTKTVSNLTNRIQKFVDCRSKDVDIRELFIVEGDSALGACKQSRNSEYQAIMPVRGKILNCLKSEYDRIFKSDIITDLIKVIGCGVEIGSKQKKGKDMISFNLDLLRWNKIIICTDADVDGFHIRTLILTMIYRLMPTLFEEGKVFIAESPLYEITCGDETWFAYTEKEKTDALAEIGNKKYTIQRSKGLGENDPDMMWLTTMNPATRRLIKIEPSFAQETADKFDLLLGDNLAGRKEHIAQNGHLYIDMADVS
ncbi:MAG: toprim domain-containing protein [Acutalibacteraceae bacterium]|nr:toprim domain-containing protein [Acutalibacteraceae bacterium]